MIKYEPFIEKYRPHKLDDIIGQDEIIKRLKEYVKNGNFPNLMFSGLQGTGKTSAAICLAMEIFKDNWYGNFKELNASDTRGIDVVRNEIKEYASTQPLGDYEFKILFLDEADALTQDAQNALRRTMEKLSKDCKFILSCNYSGKIIEPIQSRTAVYRFKPIKPNDMKKQLQYISSKENKQINQESLDALVYISEGDMRKAIGCLEVASLLGSSITIESVYKSSGLAHPKYIKQLIEISLKGSFINASELLDVLLIEDGLNSLDIIKQMFKEVMNLNITEKMKIDIIDKIGETDFRISEGADERLQMKAMLASMKRIGY